MEKYSKREDEKSRGFTVDKSGTFKDTVITNVQDIAKVFKTFNLTNDPLLNSISAKLTAFDQIDADDLREDGGLRKDIAKKAEDILADLKDLI